MTSLAELFSSSKAIISLANRFEILKPGGDSVHESLVKLMYQNHVLAVP